MKLCTLGSYSVTQRHDEAEWLGFFHYCVSNALFFNHFYLYAEENGIGFFNKDTTVKTKYC